MAGQSSAPSQSSAEGIRQDVSMPESVMKQEIRMTRPSVRAPAAKMRHDDPNRPRLLPKEEPPKPKKKMDPLLKGWKGMGDFNFEFPQRVVGNTDLAIASFDNFFQGIQKINM